MTRKNDDKPTRGEALQSPTAHSQPLLPVIAALAQLRAVLVQVQASKYTAKNLTPMEGTIGGHVRHVLDHVRLYFDGVGNGCIDYDNRQRETTIEADADAAIGEIDSLITRAQRFDMGDPAQAVEVRCAMTSDAGPCAMTSTVGREIAFVLSHTIHHFAMIGAMARAAEIELPEYFGYAPSTIAYYNQLSCAP